MLHRLPDPQTLYAALDARDPSYEGRVWVGVTSTGIFCRLSCSARTPRFENCRFYESISECLEAGFRPCKRCKPLQPAIDAEPIVQILLEALEANPEKRWSEQDIVDRKLDPSTVRRAFRRHLGMTFLEMARLKRLQNGFTVLKQGGKVIEAQLEAGFESPGAFREAFAKLMGLSPGKLSSEPLLSADWLQTPLGPMIAVADSSALHLLEFADRKALPNELKKLCQTSKGRLGVGRTRIHDLLETELAEFFAGKCSDFKVPLVMHGSPFTRAVWQELRDIPAGETRSYGDLARKIGKPNAVRAVARANGANQIAILIPCHRVIGADGSLTGYGGGLWRKSKLIEAEQKFQGPHPTSNL